MRIYCLIVSMFLIVSSHTFSATLNDCSQNGGELICIKGDILWDGYPTPQEACQAEGERLDSLIDYGELVSTKFVEGVHGNCHVTMYYPSQNSTSTGEYSVSWSRFCKVHPTSERVYDPTPGQYNIQPHWCVYYPSYALAMPDTSPPDSCSVGNPIYPANGFKQQKEFDINAKGIGNVSFKRTYNNSRRDDEVFWFNNYQRSLRVVSLHNLETIKAKSGTYHTKSYACLNGWYDLRSKISESWIQQVVPQYLNGVCNLRSDNRIVFKLPIQKSLPLPVEPYSAPISVQLIREDGSILDYGQDGGEHYLSLNEGNGKLTAVKNAAPIFWRYAASNGDIEDYNADGKLLSITASNGMKQELFYDATSGLLSRVKDSTNRELLFAYTGNQISSVTVDGNKTTSYTYNSLDLITQVTRPDNTTRIYHYEDVRFPTALTGITDERGARYATWTYDAQGRAISSEHAGGAEKTLLTFNADGSTTVTNALNKQTIYRFDDIAGARRVTKVEGQPTTNCLGANQDYTYTPEGWIASKTDWKGIKTTFTYNAVGQEISRTEAFGTPDARTITTEWHTTLFVKTKITEPGKETIYSYDANGRLLNQSTQSISVQ